MRRREAEILKVNELRILVRRGVHDAVRYRYLVLTVWAVPWFVFATMHRQHGLADWLTFEFGARTLIHYNSHYGGGALHLYSNHPFVQIGPPALAVVAAVQWLPHNAAGIAVAALMALAGVWAMRSVESTARALLPFNRRQDISVMALSAGGIALPVWVYEAGQWRHLDDVMAICFVLAATSLIARRRLWWLAGALVGVGVAAKPWALILAPVLLGLSRSERPKAAIVALVSATACWAPFVLGGPGTLKALGDFRLIVSSSSTLHLLGVHSFMAPGWVRPVQMVGGFIAMVVLARRSQWVAIPIAGFALRVITDPQTWLYYGMGPIMAAVLWDLLRGRKWPVWTLATVAVEFVVPFVVPGSVGLVRLLWALAIFASCLAYRGLDTAGMPDEELQPVESPVLQPAQ
jgi:hypothetical protein